MGGVAGGLEIAPMGYVGWVQLDEVWRRARELVELLLF